MAARYSWVTQEMFDEKLEEILDEQNGSLLLGIPASTKSYPSTSTTMFSRS